MSSFISKIKDGIGIGLGFFIVFIVLVSVYAFVEPTSSPSANYYIDWNSPINLQHNDTNDKVTTINTKVDVVDNSLDDMNITLEDIWTYVQTIKTGRPEIYMTSGTYDGDEALTACATGFHMCNYFEMQGSKINTSLNPSGNWDDLAWLNLQTDSSSPETGDCNLWTSASLFADGQVGRLYDGYYLISTSACGVALKVWCCSD